MRSLIFTGVLGVLVGTAVPACAQGNPLEFFPESTALVIRLQQPDRTIEKAAQLVEAIQPGAGQFVNQASDQLGGLLSNPGMIGVDQTKDWYVGVVLAEVGQPVPVFAVPATDAPAMVDAIDEVMNTEVHGNWVMYTEKPGKLPSPGDTNLLARLTGPSAELFNKAEVGIFVNAGHLTEVYAEQVDEMRQSVRMNIENLKNAPGMPENTPVEIYQELAETVFKVLRDSSHLTVAATFGENGVQFEDYLVVKEGSPADAWIAAHPAAALPLLQKLPKGEQAYYGVSGLSDSFLVWGLRMMSGMVTKDDQKAEIEAASQSLSQHKLEGMVGSLKLGGTPFILATTAVDGEIGDAFKESIRRLQTLTGNLEMSGMKQTTTVMPDAEEVGDQKVDIVTVKVEALESGGEAFEIQKHMNERMYGPEGMQTRAVYAANRMVATSGTLQNLESTLERLDGSADNGMGSQLETLPQPANIVGLIDLPIFYGEFFKLIGSTEGIPLQIDPSTIDNLNLQQSYTGFAVVTEPHAARFRLEIPIAQIQGAVKLGTVVFVTIQQQQGRF